MQNTLFMLFGAFLVVLGVLAAALADRIRGLRLSRETAPRARAGGSMEVLDLDPPAAMAPARFRTKRTPTSAPSDTIFVPDGPATTTRDKHQDGPATTTRDKHQAAEADEVIAALVATGYKKAAATEAVWSCGQAERATVENWTASALRRCARSAS